MKHPCSTKICFKLTFILSLLLLIIVPLIIIPNLFNLENKSSMYIIQLIFGFFFYIIMSYTFIKYWKVFPCHIINTLEINNISEQNN